MHLFSAQLVQTSVFQQSVPHPTTAGTPSCLQSQSLCPKSVYSMQQMAYVLVNGSSCIFAKEQFQTSSYCLFPFTYTLGLNLTA
jgi:hypothetical protein